MSPSQPDTTEHNAADAPVQRTRWRTHLLRLGIALLAVATLWSVVSRLTAEDPTAARNAAPSTPVTLEQSIAKLERAAKDRPDDVRVFQQLGDAYVQRGIRTLDPSFNTLADTAYSRAEKLAPGDPTTALGRAGLAATRHDFADALELAKRTLDDNSYSAGALALRVDADIELGRYDDAGQHLQEFLDRRPGAAALARVSYFRQLNGDLDGAREAITQAEAAAESGSKFDRARLVAIDGDLLLRSGSPSAAADAYRRSLAISAKLPQARIGLAHAQAVIGETDDAIATLTNLVSTTPLPAAAMLLTELQSLSGDVAGAAQSMQLVEAMTALQRSAGSRVDLDLAVFDADNTTVDAATIEQARRGYENRPSIYGADALAWTYYRAGDAASALPLVTESLRTDTADGQILFHAATVLDATGDTAQASALLAKAAQQDPWFSVARQPEAAGLAARLGVAWPTEVTS